ncbi:Hypothetical predicted protein [Mytilus galloprovincialis]|uniref:Voltage-gated hydrogen channel 1 n=1 Tax=Mytilus galloprovincialis TaxID=29158 RepID=A0A8B6D8K1_MYTGA|nr:Hypothetical predicted protein [Mytilus galloprovincialis]
MEYNEDVSHKSWKDKLGCILHNKLFHAFVVVLIVLDALIILMLLLVDLNVIPVPGETEEAKAKNHKNVENGLHYFGFSLICFFVIEIALRIIVDGAEFFKDKLNVFDAVIVLLSFILDLALTFAPVSRAVRDVVILMILLRLWRFFKLICAVNICVRKDMKEELEKERTARVKAEEERDHYKEVLQKIQNES